MRLDGPQFEDDDQELHDEAFWRDYLTHPNSLRRVGRHVFSIIPSAPRCRHCAAPFAGPGAPLMRLLGKQQSDANPN